MTGIRAHRSPGRPRGVRARTGRARLRWRARSSRRGVALVMVLAAITILAVFLVEVQNESSATLAAAVAERDALKAEYLARSGVNLSRLLVGTEPTVRRAIAPLFMMLRAKPPQIPVWEFSDQLLGAFNDARGAEAFRTLANVDPRTGNHLGLGGNGHFEVVIVDEDSKLNVNVAARGDIISETRLMAQLLALMGPQQYNSLFEQLDGDEQHSDRSAICGAIIDWADSDENMHPCDPTATGPIAAGAEDNFYQLIGLPYLRKNAAYDSLEELRLVRGISDDFWATFIEPEPDKPDKRIVTVWGQGKINVNSANAHTLLALVCANAPEAPLCIDPLQAQAFVMGVSLARTFTRGAPLFGSPKDFVNTVKGKGMVGPMLAALGLEPVVFKSESELKNMVTTESKMFSIYADGVVKGHRRETRVRIHAVVDFRGAPDLSSVMVLPTGEEDESLDSTPTTPPPPTVPEDLDPEQIMAAMVADPAGRLVYWRVQ